MYINVDIETQSPHCIVAWAAGAKPELLSPGLKAFAPSLRVVAYGDLHLQPG